MDHHRVAWVAGTRKDATTVALTEQGLTSLCTWLYTWECKHAVAVVIEHLDHPLPRRVRMPGRNHPVVQGRSPDHGKSMHSRMWIR
jgi:hypothetical protein